jgi:hypothetical protein
VLLEELAIRRLLVDVALDDVETLLCQKTSGVAASGSSGLGVEDWLGHPDILIAGSPVIGA